MVPMMETEKAELIARIIKMEQYLDEILAAKDAEPESFLEHPEIMRKLQDLIEYYENGQWLRDYESDERGEVPNGLKRGVLSEDAVYNLLAEIGI